MDDISTEVGVSKKTLYKYFKDKHELVKITMEEILSNNSLKGFKCEDGENAIAEYLEVHKKLVEMIRQASFTLESDLKKYYPKLFLRARELQVSKMKKHISANLERGINEGLYRHNLDVQAITLINVQLSLSMRNYDFLKNNRDQILKIMTVAFDYHIRGIVSEKGLQEYLRLKENAEKQI